MLLFYHSIVAANCWSKHSSLMSF